MTYQRCCNRKTTREDVARACAEMVKSSAWHMIAFRSALIGAIVAADKFRGLADALEEIEREQG